jgi:hypothetical protein
MIKKQKKETLLKIAEEGGDTFKKTIEKVLVRLDRIDDKIDLLITVLDRRNRRME